VTQTGCGALCPAVGRGCYGCFGPREQANTAALSARLTGLGQTAPGLKRLYRTFNAAAPAFETRAAAMTPESRTLRVDYLARVEARAPCIWTSRAAG